MRRHLSLFHRIVWVGAGLLLAAAACRPAPAEPVPFTVPEGFTAAPLVRDLSQPTQMIAGPDGRLWLAQLAGGENAGTGEIIAIDLADGTRETLLTGLMKPTGLAVLDNALWVAAGNTLLRAPLSADRRPEPPQVVQGSLPFNGRSNGTLTISVDGRLLYETSGALQGSTPREGSGTLWALDPAQPEAPQALATGLKGAYAHVVDASGRLWTTEIGDGRVEGSDYSGQPPDELNLVSPGADYGWPACFGAGEAALNHGGTPARCAETAVPVALFPPQSTPTGVAVAPWDSEQLLVALWVTGEVWAVSLPPANEVGVGTAVPFITNINQPQSLLGLADGRLLLSSFADGVIYQVTRE